MADGNNIVTIYQNSDLTIGDELLPGHTIINFNSFVKNLKAFARIASLPEAPLPSFSLEDSQTDKLYKTLDVEWKSARKQLNLYISTGDDWSQVGSISMLNPYGYPFRIYTLLDLFTDNLALELGENGKIGVQVQDVGYGLLTAQDSVTIHGSYVEEIFASYENKPDTTYVIVQGGSSGGGGSTTPAPDYSVSNNSIVGNDFLVGN